MAHALIELVPDYSGQYNFSEDQVRDLFPEQIKGSQSTRSLKNMEALQVEDIRKAVKDNLLVSNNQESQGFRPYNILP
jgi:hypothetical protein